MPTRDVQIAALREALESANNLSNLYFEAWRQCLAIEEQLRDQLAEAVSGE